VSVVSSERAWRRVGGALAVRGGAWRCVAVRGGVGQCGALCAGAWRCVAVRGGAWRCVAVWGAVRWRCLVVWGGAVRCVLERGDAVVVRGGACGGAWWFVVGVVVCGGSWWAWWFVVVRGGARQWNACVGSTLSTAFPPNALIGLSARDAS
jgi:hypothetical protein